MKENLVGELNEEVLLSCGLVIFSALIEQLLSLLLISIVHHIQSPISRLVKISDSRKWCRMTSQHTIGGRGADGIAMCHRGGADNAIRHKGVIPSATLAIRVVGVVWQLERYHSTIGDMSMVSWEGATQQLRRCRLATKETVNVLIVDLEPVYWGRILKSCIPSLPTRKEATKALV
ncbi:unnamed protein product [Prunus armeniaca]